MAGTARLKWEGPKIRGKMARAAEQAINDTMALCVADAKSGHKSPTKSKPHSAAREEFYNQTTDLMNSIRIFEFALAVPGRAPIGTPTGGQFVSGPGIIEGSWGADMEYAIYLEIGTSEWGPTAEERVQMAHGDMKAVPPPLGPLMAPRHDWPELKSHGYMRPAADKHYPSLAQLVREKYQAMRGPGNVPGAIGSSISHITPRGAIPIP